jgi:copper transport protein
MNAVETVVAWVDLVSTILLAGGLMYSSLVAFPASCGRRLLRLSVWVLAAALLLEIGANTLRMHRVSGIGGLPLIVDVFEMKWSRLWLLRVAGVAVIGFGMRLPRPLWHPLAAVAVGWLLLRSLQGHAGAHGTVSAVADWAHLSLAAGWLGGLTQFLLAPNRERMAAAARVRRVATVAVAVVVPSGVYAALLHVPDWHALIGSAYGRVLLTKLALVSMLLLLGAMNHFRHVPQFARGNEEAAARVFRTVGAELALGILVLLLTALLGILPMPHDAAP